MDIAGLFPDFEQLREAGFAGLGCGKPVVMIAMTPRTGSSHLCAALEAAGNTGRITEIFNPRGVIGAEKARLGIAMFADYMRAFATQPGEVLCFKTCWIDFAPVAAFHHALFPDMKVIYLDRRDVIAQAISAIRGLKTNIWHRRVHEPAAPFVDLSDKFDVEAIATTMRNLESEKAAWEGFFAARGITPARILYEDFTKDISQTLRFIREAMQFDLRTEIGPDVGYEKLADAQSQEWLERARRHILGVT